MEKLSSIQRKDKKTAGKIKYDGYLQVVELDGWEVVTEKDMVVVVPYLVSQNKVVLRYESVPPYRTRFTSQDRFLTVMSGSVEPGENMLDTAKRELEEELGIIVRDTTVFKFEKPLMVSKGNTAQYHICVLPLEDSDYVQTTPKTDGSKHEKESSNVQVNAATLSSLKVYDIVTAYILSIVETILINK